jgi:phage baseplate assembly protein W
MAITTSRLVNYSDLDFLFKSNPNTGDLGTKTEINAVKQSVLNILKTNHGEKLFQPYFGANLRLYLFENINSVTVTALVNDIKEAITNFEPRVEILNVKVNTIDDQNRISITVVVKIISTSSIVNIDTSIERLR